MPETKQLFEKQWNRQQKIIDKEERKVKTHKNKTMSSRKWLNANGLGAKKLTLLDALSPTFIPHKPKYVSIIDKHVGSKVFDDILPIAHVSDRKSGMKIVNPQAVNLNTYRDNV